MPTTLALDTERVKTLLHYVPHHRCYCRRRKSELQLHQIFNNVSSATIANEGYSKMDDLERALQGAAIDGKLASDAASLLSSPPMSSWLPGGIDYIPITSRATVMLPATEAETYMDGLKSQHDELLRALKDDEQLLMICWHGHERLEVTSISMPSNNVVAMHCIDGSGATIQVTGHMNALTFSFRVLKIEPPAVRKRIGFEMPKPE